MYVESEDAEAVRGSNLGPRCAISVHRMQAGEGRRQRQGRGTACGTRLESTSASDVAHVSCYEFRSLILSFSEVACDRGAIAPSFASQARSAKGYFLASHLFGVWFA